MEITKLFLLTLLLVTQVSSKLFDNFHVGKLPVDEIPVEKVGQENGGLLTMDGRTIDGFMDQNHEKPVDLEELVDQILELKEAKGNETGLEVLDQKFVELAGV